MASAIEEVVARAGVVLDDVSLIVAHQANERIIRYAAKKIGRPLDLFQVSIAEVGNTSASSVLMALCDAWLAGRVAPGDKVVLVGFGGGLCAGAVFVRGVTAHAIVRLVVGVRPRSEVFRLNGEALRSRLPVETVGVVFPVGGGSRIRISTLRATKPVMPVCRNNMFYGIH